jgi:hypothetical protein
LEDSENGVRAATGAGLAVVVTTNDYTAGQDFSGAVAVLDGFGEPGAPVMVQSGEPPVSGHVDLDSLERWHRLAWADA